MAAIGSKFNMAAVHMKVTLSWLISKLDKSMQFDTNCLYDMILWSNDEKSSYFNMVAIGSKSNMAAVNLKATLNECIMFIFWSCISK